MRSRSEGRREGVVKTEVCGLTNHLCKRIPKEADEYMEIEACVLDDSSKERSEGKTSLRWDVGTVLNATGPEGG